MVEQLGATQHGAEVQIQQLQVRVGELEHNLGELSAHITYLQQREHTLSMEKMESMHEVEQLRAAERQAKEDLRDQQKQNEAILQRLKVAEAENALHTQVSQLRTTVAKPEALQTSSKHRGGSVKATSTATRHSVAPLSPPSAAPSSAVSSPAKPCSRDNVLRYVSNGSANGSPIYISVQEVADTATLQAATKRMFRYLREFIHTFE